MSRKADMPDRMAKLAAVLGADPPAGLAELTDDELLTLVTAIESSQENHRREVIRAESDLLHHVPRPLRGTVKRIIR